MAVIAKRVLLEAVGEGVDLLLCGILLHISLDVGEVVSTVPVVQTAQTDQLMVFGVLIAGRDFDNDVLYTVPQNVDVVL